MLVINGKYPAVSNFQLAAVYRYLPVYFVSDYYYSLQMQGLLIPEMNIIKIIFSESTLQNHLSCGVLHPIPFRLIRAPCRHHRVYIFLHDSG